MSVRLAAVLVNYNAGDELRVALQSIATDAGGLDWEAVVVDNASIDGSENVVERFGPRARLIRNRDNMGFGRGVNQAIAVTTAPLILIMNPDCRLLPGAIATLMDELDRHPQCAVVGPRTLDPDGSVQGTARGDPNMLTGLFGRTSALRRGFPTLAVAHRNVVSGPGLKPVSPGVKVDWVAGACMLVRRSAFEQVSGFDERYFLYWEDADLCRRLRNAGHQVRYVPSATAVHRVGHSSQQARTIAIRAFHDSAYLYYATHVAPHRGHPKRLLARALLSARCWLQLQRVAD